MPSLTIGRRYRGFDRVAQGGYSSGLLAGHLRGPVQVRLRAPVPMETELKVEKEAGGVVLRGEGGVLAEAGPAELELEAPARVTLEQAAAASDDFPGHRAHPYPECFCCGPARAADDGLRIFPAPVGEGGPLAAVWTPGAALAAEDGLLAPEFLWAAFDCPQLWALMLGSPDDSTEHVVTAALETEVREPIRADATYAVLSWPLGSEGRRHHAGAALLDAEGRTLAVSRQTAVTAPAGVPLGRGWEAAAGS